MAAGNDERRPHDGAASSVEHLTNTHDSTPRCWICGRALHAEKSVALGIGPRCWDARMGGAA